MSSSCPTQPGPTLDTLRRHLPETPLFGVTDDSNADNIGWMLSPEPYELNNTETEVLHKLGPVLARFSLAVDQLYKTALKDSRLGWVRDLFHRGKPPQLIQFAQMNRFKNQLPLVLRPDL